MKKKKDLEKDPQYTKMLSIEKDIRYEIIQKMRGLSLKKLDFIIEIEELENKIKYEESRWFGKDQKLIDSCKEKIKKLKINEIKLDKQIEEKASDEDDENTYQMDELEGLADDIIVTLIKINLSNTELVIYEDEPLLKRHKKTNNFLVNRGKYNDNNILMRIEVIGFLISCELYKKAMAINISIRNTFIYQYLIDNKKFDKIMYGDPNAPENSNVLQIGFYINPNFEKTNYKLVLDTERQVYLIINMYILQYIQYALISSTMAINFFEIANYAENSITQYIQYGYAMQTQSADHFNIDLKVKFKSPIIIIPFDIHDKNSQSIHMYLGTLEMRSELPPREVLKQIKEEKKLLINKYEGFKKLATREINYSIKEKNFDNNLYDTYKINIKGIKMSTTEKFCSYLPEQEKEMVKEFDLYINFSMLVDDTNKFLDKSICDLEFSNFDFSVSEFQILYLFDYLKNMNIEMNAISKITNENKKNQGEEEIKPENVFISEDIEMKRFIEEQQKAKLSKEEKEKIDKFLEEKTKEKTMIKYKKFVKSYGMTNFDSNVENKMDKIKQRQKEFLLNIKFKEIILRIKKNHIDLTEEDYMIFVMNDFTINMMSLSYSDLLVNLGITNIALYDRDMDINKNILIEPHFQCIIQSFNDSLSPLSSTNNLTTTKFLSISYLFESGSDTSLLDMEINNLSLTLGLQSLLRLYQFSMFYLDRYTLIASFSEEEEKKINEEDEEEGKEYMEEVKNMIKDNINTKEGKAEHDEMYEKMKKNNLKTKSKLELMKEKQDKLLEQYLKNTDNHKVIEKAENIMVIKFFMNNTILKLPLDQKDIKTPIFSFQFNLIYNQTAKNVYSNTYLENKIKHIKSLIRTEYESQQTTINLLINKADMDVVYYIPKLDIYSRNMATERLLSNFRMLCKVEMYIIPKEEQNVLVTDLLIEPMKCNIGSRQLRKLLTLYERVMVFLNREMLEKYIPFLEPKNVVEGKVVFSKKKMTFKECIKLIQFQSRAIKFMKERVRDRKFKIVKEKKVDLFKLSSPLINTDYFNNHMIVLVRLNKFTLNLFDNSGNSKILLLYLSIENLFTRYFSNSRVKDKKNVKNLILEMLTGKDIPITEYTATNLCQYLKFYMTISSNYYNLQLSEFEPFIEPFTLRVFMNQTTEFSKLKMYISILEMVNFNISSNSIKILNMFLLKLYEDEKNWGEPKRFGGLGYSSISRLKSKNSKEINNVDEEEIITQFFNKSGVDIKFSFDSNPYLKFNMKENNLINFTRTNLSEAQGISKHLKSSKGSNTFSVILMKHTLIKGLNINKSSVIQYKAKVKYKKNEIEEENEDFTDDEDNNNSKNKENINYEKTNQISNSERIPLNNNKNKSSQNSNKNNDNNINTNNQINTNNKSKKNKNSNLNSYLYKEIAFSIRVDTNSLVKKVFFSGSVYMKNETNFNEIFVFIENENIERNFIKINKNQKICTPISWMLTDGVKSNVYLKLKQNDTKDNSYKICDNIGQFFVDELTDAERKNKVSLKEHINKQYEGYKNPTLYQITNILKEDVGNKKNSKILKISSNITIYLCVDYIALKSKEITNIRTNQKNEELVFGRSRINLIRERTMKFENRTISGNIETNVNEQNNININNKNNDNEADININVNNNDNESINEIESNNGKDWLNYGFEYIICFRPCVTFTNRVPFDLTFSYFETKDLNNPRSSGSFKETTISPLKKEYLYNLTADDNIKNIIISINYYDKKYISDIFKLAEINSSSSNKGLIELYNENDRSKYLTIRVKKLPVNFDLSDIGYQNLLEEEIHSTLSFNFVFYFDFIIVNRFCNDLYCISDDKGNNSSSEIYLPSHKIGLLNSNSKETKLKLREEDSKWSDAFSADVPGTDGVIRVAKEIEGKNGKIGEEGKSKIIKSYTEIGCIIDTSKLYINSVIIIFEVRYLLVNNLGFDIYYKQTTKEENEDTLDIEKIEYLLPKSKEQELRYIMDKENNKDKGKYYKIGIYDKYSNKINYSEVFDINNVEDSDLIIKIDPKDAPKKGDGLINESGYQSYNVFTYDGENYYILIRAIIHTYDNALVYVMLTQPLYPYLEIYNKTDKGIYINDSTRKEPIYVRKKACVPFIYGDNVIKNGKLTLSLSENSSSTLKFSFRKLKTKQRVIDNIPISASVRQRHRGRSRCLFIEESSNQVKGISNIFIGEKKSVSSSAFFIFFKGIGMSIIDEEPREVFYISFYRLGLTYISTSVEKKNSGGENTNKQIIYFKLNNFQIDYCLNDSFKNILYPKIQVTPKNDQILRKKIDIVDENEAEFGNLNINKNKNDNYYKLAPFLSMICVIETVNNLTNNESYTKYPDISLILSEFNLKIEQYGCVNLLNVITNYTSLLNYSEQLNLIKQKEEENFLETTIKIPYIKLASENENSTMLNIDHLYLSEFAFKLTLRLDLSRISISKIPKTIMRVAGSIGNSLTRITDSPLNFAENEYQNIYMSTDDLVSKLISFYTKQGIMEIYKILGSFDIIGNPLNFVKSVGRGFYDLVNEPIRGCRAGTCSSISLGFFRGFTGLLYGVVGGVADAVGRVSGTLYAGTLGIQGRAREAVLEQKEPEHLIEGIATGFAGGAREIGLGITGIVTHPVNKYKQQGMCGFVKGCGKAVVCLITSPFSCAFKIINCTSIGLKNTLLLLHGKKKLKPTRFRCPRVIVEGCPIDIFDAEKAIARQAVFEIYGVSVKNIILAKEFRCGEEKFKRKPCTLVLTTSYLLVIYNNSKIIFKIKVNEVEKCSLHKKNDNFIICFKMKNKPKLKGFKINDEFSRVSVDIYDYFSQFTQKYEIMRKKETINDVNKWFIDSGKIKMNEKEENEKNQKLYSKNSQNFFKKAERIDHSNYSDTIVETDSVNSIKSSNNVSEQDITIEIPPPCTVFNNPINRITKNN